MKTIMKLVKSTKGTHVYGTDDTEAVIPSLYVKKHGLPSVPPQKITVEITYED